MTTLSASSRCFGSIFEAVNGRPLYVWGAGNQGRGLCRVLERQKVRIEGFIDNSSPLHGTTVLGHRVLSPSEVLPNTCSTLARPFIIIASFFFEEQIGQECTEAGLEEGRDFISYTRIKPYDWAVDISGVCNLHCLSCPRARRDPRHPQEGFMAPETFAQVLDKILCEDPLAGNMQLYQWGEPLLNPKVAAIIEIANSKGVQCAVSSNLNDDRNLEDVVRAGPAWFRVSVSGWGINYERTHTGGRWGRFHRNFIRLAELRKQYKPDMKAEVYYHIYKHNQGDDAKLVRDLCGEVGFEFHPVYAYLISLDDVLDHLEGRSLPEAVVQAKQMLALSLEEGLELARAQCMEPCLTLRCIHVNWDLSVSNCMMFFNTENNRATDNFLATPLEEIVRRRASCALCRRCMRQSLHRYCSVYSTKPTSLMDSE